MNQIWHEDPQFKVETNGQTFVNQECFRLEITRPINNVAFLVLSVDDYQSKNFIDVFAALNRITVSLRYGSDSWTIVFVGTISTVKPHLSIDRGEILEVAAWGLGWCLIQTHCNTSYGKESKHPTIDTPLEIWTDLRDNYVQKSFGGANTGYSVGLATQGGATPTITYLESQYKRVFDIINTTLDLITANEAGSASHQWFMDPNSTLHLRPINNNADPNWPEYWNGSQAASRLEVTKDMILYDFRKNIEEYANKIVLCSLFRKPANDYWTENQKALWGNATAVLTDDAANYIVGSYSLKLEPLNPVDAAFMWYPSSQDAAWNFEKIGSEKTIPTVNFYARRNQDLGSGSHIRLCTDATNYFYINPLSDIIGVNDEFVHLSIPIGPYYYTVEESRRWRWLINNSPDWADINYITFCINSASGTNDLWIDDLHFAGKIIREAYDSTAIANNKEYQRIIRNDTAVNDTLKASDDSETAAALAYAELLRRKQTPIVGMIQIPLAVNMLPGQKVYVLACKQADATFRIEKDFRVISLTDIISTKNAITNLNLTDDLTNSHAFGVPTQYSILAQYAGALGHAEAKNLKASGIDVLIPRLSKDYPS